MKSICTLASAACLGLLTFALTACGGSSSGPTVSSIDIAPISPSIPVGGTQQFTGTAHYSDGSSADITHTANWSSDNSAVATVQATGTQPGLATGVAAGKCNVTVSFAQGSSSVQASTDLTVTKTKSAQAPPSDRTTTADVVIRGFSSHLQLDGKPVRTSGLTAIAIAPGVHQLTIAGSRATFTLRVQPGAHYALQISPAGVIAFDASEN